MMPRFFGGHSFDISADAGETKRIAEHGLSDREELAMYKRAHMIICNFLAEHLRVADNSQWQTAAPREEKTRINLA